MNKHTDKTKKNTRLKAIILLTGVITTASGLAAWKQDTLTVAAQVASSRPEPVEMIASAIAEPYRYQPTTKLVGTVIASRSITLQNELPGTVKTINLKPGRIVDAGDLLVTLDISVEQAELKAHKARAALARSVFERTRKLWEKKAVSQEELDQARADLEVINAEISRIEAIIERKRIRAPFHSRTGLSDVHIGQYLNEGTLLTTLQGVSEDVHIDFAVDQQIAATLEVGDAVEVLAGKRYDVSVGAAVMAVDARVDPSTRNATVRARATGNTLSPGMSVQVRVPIGTPLDVISIPSSALRKSPAGDHVFVVVADADGVERAYRRPVDVVVRLGNIVLIDQGINTGEVIATNGSFKLRESTLVSRSGTTGPVPEIAL